MFSLSLYKLACQAELPRSIRKKMLYHISLGLIPILGILLDMLYRAHIKNLRLLRRFLYERARQQNVKLAEEKALANDDRIPLSERETDIS
ncbi:hypothetical protein RMCBS344292_00670 [Rhizopus microsporus]|nr:hypothetical protein RMCBS344292_00670 [Rhizopus microsporus]